MIFYLHFLLLSIWTLNFSHLGIEVSDKYKLNEGIAQDSINSVKNKSLKSPIVNTNALYKGKGKRYTNDSLIFIRSSDNNYQWVISPKFNSDGVINGVVVCELYVSPDGNILRVKPGIKGSTFYSEKIYKMLEEGFLKAKFKVISKNNTGRIVHVTINFKAR